MAATPACTNRNELDRHGYPYVSFSKALEYMSCKHSCLFEIKSEKEIKLPPRYIGRIDQGIRESLDVDLLKYSEEFDGIIFAYNRVECLEMSGSINDEMPLIFFRVVVKYIVFKPQIGMTLKGVVNKVGHGHYGCLVHDCFNASIQKPNLTDNTSKKFKKILKNTDVGSEFLFKITGLDVHNDILSIKGDFDDTVYAKKRNNGQAKRAEMEAEGNNTNEKVEQIPNGLQNESLSIAKAKKKKKKDKKGLPNIDCSMPPLSNSSDGNTDTKKTNSIKEKYKFTNESPKEDKTSLIKHSKKLKRRKSELYTSVQTESDMKSKSFSTDDAYIPKTKKKKSL